MRNKSLVSKLQSWVSRQLLPEAYIESSTALKGQVIIVTGSARGIGRATAQLLLTKGATIVPIYRTRIAANPDPAYTADITSSAQVESVIQQIISKYGKVDAIVNCAGEFIDKPLASTSPEEFRRIMDVNVVGAYNLAHAAIPYMKAAGRGLLLNIGSKISHNTNVAPGKVTYATSKYAVEGLSFALNKELKPFGIRVCCLMPGTVATFASRKGKEYLSPHELASVIEFIIRSKNIDFEGIVLKSINQNI